MEVASVKQFTIDFEYIDKMWIARCEELRITLEEGSFDALVIRMKMAVQDIAETELQLEGDIQLKINKQLKDAGINQKL